MIKLRVIKNFILKEKYFILSSIILGFFITILITSKNFAQNIQESISNELIRFHVLANSDTEYDQDLKIKVKESVINFLEKELKESKSKIETKNLITENMQEIINIAKEVIKENGYDYDVSAKITTTYFPTKVYGDISLPAGIYEALQIKIGEAKGQNWWCVMFPPLCFVDVTFNEVSLEDKVLLKTILNEDEYELISKNKKDIPVKIKFKIIEFWQEIINN